MQASTAIIIGSTVIGACVLANLGYAVHHDQAVAEGQRRERDQQVKAAAQNYKKVQSKEAWQTALKFMDVEFRDWLETQIKPDKKSVVHVPFAWTKAFDLSDVQWDDAQNVTVHGLIGAQGRSGTTLEYFAWTRKVELLQDGVDSWWQAAEHPVFDYGTATGVQEEHMRKLTIIWENHEIPLVR